MEVINLVEWLRDEVQGAVSPHATNDRAKKLVVAAMLATSDFVVNPKSLAYGKLLEATNSAGFVIKVLVTGMQATSAYRSGRRTMLKATTLAKRGADALAVVHSIASGQSVVRWVIPDATVCHALTS